MSCPVLSVRGNIGSLFFLLVLLCFEALDLLQQVVHPTREDAVGDSLRVSHVVPGLGPGEAEARQVRRCSQDDIWT